MLMSLNGQYYCQPNYKGNNSLLNIKVTTSQIVNVKLKTKGSNVKTLKIKN